MALAGRSEWIIRTGHFAERHGLIVIIALGEVIVAIGVPVVNSLEAGQGLPGATLVALVAAGVFAALLWWAYFDRPGPSLEHRGGQVEGDLERGRFARDVYTLAHAPLVAGIILAAAALEEMALHPASRVPLEFRSMLAGGMALAVTGVALGVWRAWGVIAWERLVAASVIAALVLAATAWPANALLIAVDAVILATLAVEHVRIEG
jgi:low temperature requirement protein LtrA